MPARPPSSASPVRESGSQESGARMSAKISLASRGTAQSPVNHRGKSSSGLLLAGKSVKRPSSMSKSMHSLHVVVCRFNESRGGGNLNLV